MQDERLADGVRFGDHLLVDREDVLAQVLGIEEGRGLEAEVIALRPRPPRATLVLMIVTGVASDGRFLRNRVPLRPSGATASRGYRL